MDYRTTCSIQAGNCFLPAVVLFAVPASFAGWLGLDPTLGNAVLVRALGGLLFALGATLLGARDLEDAAAKRVVALGNFSADGALGIVFGSAGLAGALGPLGSLLGAVFLASAVGWVVVVRKTPREA